MPFAEVSIDGGELRFRRRSLGAFRGRLSDDGEHLAGALGDGDAALPITFQRGIAVPGAPARPLHPQAPFPYEVEEVCFDGSGCRLAGTLTKPLNQPRSLAMLAAAGLLVGVGTRLGTGCTSGHGVCGLSRLSPRSLAATLTFIASGMLAVLATRLLGGGS